MLTTDNVILCLTMAVSLAAAVIICANAYRLGLRLGLMDEPDRTRKCHATSTPLVGGVAICTTMFLWTAIRLALGIAAVPQLKLTMLLCGSGMAIVGFADDQHPLSPLVRIFLLLTFLFIAFFIDPSLIATTLHWGSFASTPISPWVCVPLMAVAAAGLVNAVNMADGQNGIVAGMFVVWFTCLALVGGTTVMPLSIVMGLASIIVLRFNLAGKLFLGDCGTYGVTFAFGLLVIATHAAGTLTIETIGVWFFIPVADCIRLMISRLRRGKSPFEGDRNHFHHILQEVLGPNLSFVVYVGVVAVSSLTATLVPHAAPVCLLGLSVFFASFAFRTSGRVESAGTEAPMIAADPSKILAFNPSSRNTNDSSKLGQLELE